MAAVVSFDEITEDSGEPRLRYTAAAQQLVVVSTAVGWSGDPDTPFHSIGGR